MTPGVIHQYPPHRLGRDRKKMSPILPLHALAIYQAHVYLVNQGGRLEGVVGPFASHIAMGQAPKFFVNDWGQLVKRVLISIAPGAEKTADLAGIQLTRHAPGSTASGQL
jgi:hypothetical protein